jgi:hypothetical protein
MSYIVLLSVHILIVKFDFLIKFYGEVPPCFLQRFYDELDKLRMTFVG